jgi:CheY-like chemotaxis protein
MERFPGALQRPIVLIVEDDPLISMTVEDIVTDAGFDYESTINAADGIAALEKSGTRFSALITDIRMPGKGNGWDVGHRAHELLPLLPIIYMTGDSAEQWKAHGETGSILLQKPFADGMLITALTALIA